MDSSIWKGSSSPDARNEYIELASKYKQKHGSLSGFLAKNGALLLGDNLHKVRVSGDRLKLASIWSYNKYQSLRSSREGYSNIRADLKELGVSKREIDAFIAKDKKLYKSKVQQIKNNETKGHIQSLDSGGRDGSWNIESEPATDNFSKKSQSPSSAALLGEGVPRNTREAFLRSKDPSGLPDPSDFTPAERAQLRKLKTADEVDDFLTKKYEIAVEQDNRFRNGDNAIKEQILAIFKGTANRAGEKILRNTTPGVGTALDWKDTGQRWNEFMENPNLINGAQLVTQAVSSTANTVSDVALATGVGAPIAAKAEGISGLATIADAGLEGLEGLQGLTSKPK